MNKKMTDKPQGERVERSRFKLDSRIKDVLLLGVLALVLVVAAWKIFYKDETKETLSVVQSSESEEKVGRLLREIEGVGDANVMICETEDGVTGVVVVCEGANDLQVIMNVREAVAAALGTEEKAVKIYLKKE